MRVACSTDLLFTANAQPAGVSKHSVNMICALPSEHRLRWGWPASIRKTACCFWLVADGILVLRLLKRSPLLLNYGARDREAS